MRGLQGKVSLADLELINNSIKLRFEDHRAFKTPEALVVYEQRMVDEDVLLELVEDEYGFDLEIPPISFVPQEILDFYKDMQCIPIKIDNVNDEIHLAVIPEHQAEYIPPYKGLQVVRRYVPIYYYVENYTKLYRRPTFLKEIPPKDLLDIIVSEAINLGAADITIAERANSAIVYYNVKKRRIDSRRVINKEEVTNIAKILASEASMTIMPKDKSPIYPSVNLDPNHRGRVIIGRNYHGMYITTRVLPNKLFDTSLEDLKLTTNVVKFVREVFMSDEKGLRLMIGPTFSGKNTTASSGLYEKIKYKEYKTVSVEFPVELIVDEMEQMNCESEEEFVKNCSSLLRQNPDICYITEMTDTTSRTTMEVANTGKVVISSIHANSIADCVSRIQDLTKFSLDRIIQNLQSAIYQELIPVGEMDIMPVNTCLHFTQELKDQLLGKSLGEVTQILREVEAQWVS